MSLILVKVALALVVLAIGVLGAVLPWRLSRSPSDRSLAIGDTFAGGVLGAAGLVHLLPAGAADLASVLPGLSFPLPATLAGVGFLLVLLIEGVIVADRPLPFEAHGHHHSPSASHEVGSPARPTRTTAVLLVVLSIHSVILGLALGAQRSLAAVAVVAVAIVAHKGMAAFALGVGYRRSEFSRSQALPSIGLFAASTPTGILLGTVLAAVLTGSVATWFEAIFDSVGAGTLLYIAALDIIRTEFDAPEDRLAKWMATAGGFAMMAALALWL